MSEKNNKKTIFDEAIKENLIKSGHSKDEFGYNLSNNSCNKLYYTDVEFDKFVTEMKNQYNNHYIRFADGKGSELLPKGGNPPKMASVASSSRFCYLALRNGTQKLMPGKTVTKDDIVFEKGCRIFKENYTSPQLDAYITDDKCDTFIEAKCHEIFDSHSVVFSNKYKECFEDDAVLKPYLKYEEPHSETEFKLPLSVFDLEKKTSHFDIKQMLSHLIGIATQGQGKLAKLIFMFFKPVTDNKEASDMIEKMFKELKDEINKIFASDLIKNYCQKHNIALSAIALNSAVMQEYDKSNIIVLA